MKYGTKINGIEWEIDLEEKRMTCLSDPKVVRKLKESEVALLRRNIKENGG